MTDCLAEVAAELLRTDGVAVIWQAHINRRSRRPRRLSEDGRDPS